VVPAKRIAFFFLFLGVIFFTFFFFASKGLHTCTADVRSQPESSHCIAVTFSHRPSA
jgi:hypothetical protein